MEQHIAITVRGREGLDALMDPRFGRARWYLLVAGSEVEVLDNPAFDAQHGAGIAAAALMGEKGVTDVIAGHFGPKAERGLAGQGVRMWNAPEGLTAREAVERLARGELAAQGTPR